MMQKETAHVYSFDMHRQTRQHRTLSILVAACVLWLICTGIAYGQDQPAPDERSVSGADQPLEQLAEALRQSLLAIPIDPAPKQIIRDVHYVISNEYNLHHFYDALKDRSGGIHIGVGAEQNFLFAGWSRPEILVLLDFDKFIVDLHHLYGIAFLNSPTIEDFVTLWSLSKKQKRQFHKLIDASIEDGSRRARLKRIYKHSRLFVHKRAHLIQRTYTKLGIPTFLTDPKQYQTIVELFRTGRVLPIRGDLTKYNSMQGIAKWGKEHNIPVRTLYLSNTEYYFGFNTSNYRNNILAMPFDDKSVVLHTVPHSGTEYYYVWHSGANFQAWAECRCVRKFRSLLKHSERQGHAEKRLLLKFPDTPKAAQSDPK
jgi:hypothetical protein